MAHGNYYSIQVKRRYQRTYDRMDSGDDMLGAMIAMARIINSETNINDSPHKIRIVCPEGKTIFTTTHNGYKWQ